MKCKNCGYNIIIHPHGEITHDRKVKEFIYCTNPEPDVIEVMR